MSSPNLLSGKKKVSRTQFYWKWSIGFWKKIGLVCVADSSEIVIFMLMPKRKDRDGLLIVDFEQGDITGVAE